MKTKTTKKSKTKKTDNIAADVWSNLYFETLSKLDELKTASRDYMEASEDYQEGLEDRLYECSSECFELTTRAKSAEEMLVDVKQQLETMTENRNYYLELSEERWVELEKAYTELKETEKSKDYWHKCWEQAYGALVKTQRSWFERIADWWGEK